MAITLEHDDVIDPRLLSVTEATERVGLKHLEIRRAIQRGEFRASKLCGRIRIEPSELDRWIRSIGIAASAGQREP